MQVVVLGAGLAGLAAAVRAAREGCDVVVLEAGDEAGGMARSLHVGGWWLDHGPHRFWSRDEHVLALAREMLDGDTVESERRSQILLLGRRFQYPLDAADACSKLPARVLARAAAEWAFERTRQLVRPTPDSDFEDWVVKRFGRTLHELFFGQYTEKAWGVPCSAISPDWASQRIAQTGLFDAAKTMLFPRLGAHSRSLAARFLYPRRGGIGALPAGFARHLRRLGGSIEFGSRVERVETRGGRAVAVSGCGPRSRFRVECDALVSTIPLPQLARALDPAPGPAVRADAARLAHRAVRFAHLEVARPKVSDNHWIYLPERHLSVHRVTEFKNFCAEGAPADRTALCAEITCRPGDEVWSMDDAGLARLAEHDLAQAGLVAPGETRLLATARLEHAYPLYDLGYKERVDALKQALRGVENLRSTGRQGLHRYNNMDHSIAMGWHAAKGLARGAATAKARPDEAVAAAQEWFG